MLSFTPLRLRPLKGAGAVGHNLLYMALGGDCLRRVLRARRCFSWATPVAREEMTVRFATDGAAFVVMRV